MKIINIIYYTVLLSLFAAITGCSDVFDHQPVGTITPGEVWEDQTKTALYVNNFYGLLPSWARYETYSEEAGNINDFLNNKMQVSSSFPGGVDWGSAYSSIRAMNVFFENINNVPGMTNDLRKKLKGQVQFFRAYLYLSMVRVYGGVPIITDIQDPTDLSDKNMVKRNTTLECFDYIVENLDSAINNLPSKWPDSDLGRISKGAAMAVKAQALMLKASPLFCPLQNHTDFWSDAYAACNLAYNELNANEYGLYTGNNAYEMMWYDKAGAKREIIISVRFADPTKQNRHQAGQRPLSVSAGAAGACQPTWEMVKAYPMKNGKNIEEISSGYKEDYFWVDRDPRFYKTVVFNSATYGFGSNAKRVQWNYPNCTPDGYRVDNGTRTGFYCRKGVDTTLVIGDLAKQAFDWPVLRYSEVLLDLAECANEAGHPDVAKKCIVKIRQRAGIEDDGSGNYGLGTGVGSDYKATFDAVMKERQIELAYEGKRFWDLRRRRMFNVLNNYGTWHAYAPYLADTKGTIAEHNLEDINQITGFFSDLIYNPPIGSTSNEVRRIITRYEVEVIDKNTDNVIKIPDTYYFWPLSPNWIQKDPNLVQNKGWETGTFDPTIP